MQLVEGRGGFLLLSGAMPGKCGQCVMVSLHHYTKPWHGHLALSRGLDFTCKAGKHSRDRKSVV